MTFIVLDKARVDAYGYNPHMDFNYVANDVIYGREVYIVYFDVAHPLNKYGQVHDLTDYYNLRAIVAQFVPPM